MAHDQQDTSHLSVSRRGFFRKLLTQSLQLAENAALELGEQVGGALVGTKPPGKEPDNKPGGEPISGIAGDFLASGVSGVSGVSGLGLSVLSVDPPTRLFPPGSVDAFEQTCSRSGDCVRACPAQCILQDQGMLGGLPHLMVRQSPCVVCDSLACTVACQSGALRPLDKPEDIHIGLAVVDPGSCLRAVEADDSVDQSGSCQQCVDQCPLGDQAIGIGSKDEIAVLPGCTGCGVCQWVCPTEPASIVVVPYST